MCVLFVCVNNIPSLSLTYVGDHLAYKVYRVLYNVITYVFVPNITAMC